LTIFSWFKGSRLPADKSGESSSIEGDFKKEK